MIPQSTYQVNHEWAEREDEDREGQEVVHLAQRESTQARESYMSKAKGQYLTMTGWKRDARATRLTSPEDVLHNVDRSLGIDDTGATAKTS